MRDVIVPTVRDARSAAGKDADSFATVAALAFLRGIGRRRVRIWAIWVGSNFVRLWVGADQVSDSEDQEGGGTADEQLTCPGA